MSINGATMTLDQVIASNVHRLRNEKHWTRQDLADRLGVTRHVVRDYEGRRAGRAQRPFRWTEIVALCYVLRVTLYELVLPADSDTEVQDPALYPFPIGDVAGGGWPRRHDLGYGLFGVPGDKLLDAVNLKTFETWVQKETDRRTKALDQAAAGLRDMADVVQKIGEKRPGITGRELLERYGGERTLPEILEIISDEEEE